MLSRHACKEGCWFSHQPVAQCLCLALEQLLGATSDHERAPNTPHNGCQRLPRLPADLTQITKLVVWLLLHLNPTPTHEMKRSCPPVRNMQTASADVMLNLCIAVRGNRGPQPDTTAKMEQASTAASSSARM